MAIEPIKGFYVHDEATDTDGVAKYSADSLDNLDETVSLAGYAPDAKAVGDRLTDVENLAETLNEGGLELKDDVIATNVSDWLDDHPEATTTVQDGAITKAKINTAFLPEIENAYVTPEMFGAKGDGVTDDVQAINTMLKSVDDNTTCIFNNSYFISEGFVIDKPVNIIMPGEILADVNAEFGVRVQGHAPRCNMFELNIKSAGEISETWSSESIGLDLYNCWENTFDVNIRGFRTGIRLYASDIDCTYNKVLIRKIYNCKSAIMLTGNESVLGGTVAQNTFFGGRIHVAHSSYTLLDANDPDDCYIPVDSILTGNRTNNNNNFISVSFEGFGVQPTPYENRAIIQSRGDFCVFLGCRYEGIVSFAGGLANSVIGGYASQLLNIMTDTVSVTNSYNNDVNTYSRPFKFMQGGTSQNLDNHTEYYDTAKHNIYNVTKTGSCEAKSLIITANDNTLYADSRRRKISGTTSSDLNNITSGEANGDIKFTNHGHIVSKNLTGTDSYIIQPIIKTRTSFAVPGTMAFVSGRPIWYTGTKWVYADGTDA